MKALRISLLLLIVYFGSKALQEAIQGVDVGFLSLQLSLLGLILSTLIEILIGGVAFSNSRKFIHLVPSLLGCIFLIVIFVQKNKFSNIENAKTIFSIRTAAGEEALVFIFKENGNFIIEEYISPLRIKKFYGKYSMKNDSIIIIDHSYKGYAGILPRIGVILDDTVYWKGFEKMFFFDQ